MLGRFKGQHLLLQAPGLEAVAEVLVGAGFGAVALELLAIGQQLLLHDAATLLAFLHLIKLAAALLDAAVEQGHASELVDDAAPVAGAHRDDAGDIALHHHVAALGIHPQAPQLGLQLLQVAGHAVGAKAAAVGAPWGDAQPAADAPGGLAGLDPRALLGGLEAGFGPIGLPIAEVKAHGDHRFGRLALAKHGAVDQVGQPISPHAPAGGQAQAKQHPIENVAFARAVWPRNHSETFLERDRDRSAKGLEMGELDLIDVNQQARAPSSRNVADPSPISTPSLAWGD